MKAAPFSYVRPTSPVDAIAELVASGGNAKVLAGGQSLMPVLAMRLGRPTTLIDITRVEQWRRIDVGAEVRIGAAVRQRAVERRTDLTVPLLARALPWIGHREIRSCGTICGSLAHADPASELPAVALVLDARMSIRGSAGTREIAAVHFFQGAMTTAISTGEVLQHVTLPRRAPGEGFGFAEIARRHGDFALVGVATKVRMDGDRIVSARLGAFGVADRPVMADVTTQIAEPLRAALDGGRREPVADALRDVARQLVTTGGDKHASASYRRRLLRTLGARELLAAARASQKENHR